MKYRKWDSNTKATKTKIVLGRLQSRILLAELGNNLQDLNVLIRSSLKNCGIFNKTEHISLHGIFNKTKHISLQKRLTPNLPQVRVNADDTSFVIVNLLTNVLDSMPNDGELLIESRYCKEHDSCVQISISDTGNGIKRCEEDKMFDPFFTTKGNGKGIGLGLAISKRIIEDYGGKINVASTQGRGTTITLCLPAVCKSAKPRVVGNMHLNEMKAVSSLIRLA